MSKQKINPDLHSDLFGFNYFNYLTSNFIPGHIALHT